MTPKNRRVLLGALGTGLLAAALADLLGRAAGFGALGAGPAADRVALTFDDGPSPRTPELLAVLARHGAQATFFVLEPHARALPAELRALRGAGHQLESHGRWHRHALLLAPWQEWRQVRWHPDGTRLQRGRLYRPPYGGHSPLTRPLTRLAGREVALWDTEGRDWTDAPAADLAAQTLARVRPGSVVLLHDGPAVTPELLDLLLRGLHGRGLRAVRLDELPPQRIGWRAGLGRLRQSYGG